MQSWIRDLIDLKTQISVLQNCMHAASQYAHHSQTRLSTVRPSRCNPRVTCVVLPPVHGGGAC
eukprot:COSAG01_NODE_1928_length_8876_cov_12.801641_2_plen_63_part_00